MKLSWTKMVLKQSFRQKMDFQVDLRMTECYLSARFQTTAVSTTRAAYWKSQRNMKLLHALYRQEIQRKLHGSMSWIRRLISRWVRTKWTSERTCLKFTELVWLFCFTFLFNLSFCFVLSWLNEYFLFLIINEKFGYLFIYLIEYFIWYNF